MSIQTAFQENANTLYSALLQQLTSESWISSDVMSQISFSEYTYNLQKENSTETETGVYALERIGNYNVIQFLCDSEPSVLNDTYSIEFGEKTVTEKVKKKTVEKTVTDYDTIIFTPVKITTTDCFATEGRIFTLTRKQNENQN